MWALVNVSHLYTRNGFGRPLGPTDLCVEQPLNVLQERLLLWIQEFDKCQLQQPQSRHYLIEGDQYETQQSSLLYVFVLFFGLDRAQNTIVVYY